jgi:acetate kinase
LDSIIFSGGIGENAPQIRQKICEYLAPLNVRIHLKKNMNVKTGKKFHSFSSKVKLRSLHADEESEMNRVLMAQGKN